jgi:hypothetical protein
MAYNDPNWMPEEVLASLNLEQRVHGDELSHSALSRKIFEENAPLAAARIAHLAAHANSEQVALRAATYITDRVLGKVGDDSETVDPLQKFLDDMSANAESHANKRV